jgi:hypothetical protein
MKIHSWQALIENVAMMYNFVLAVTVSDEKCIAKDIGCSDIEKSD